MKAFFFFFSHAHPYIILYFRFVNIYTFSRHTPPYNVMYLSFTQLKYTNNWFTNIRRSRKTPSRLNLPLLCPSFWRANVSAEDKIKRHLKSVLETKRTDRRFIIIQLETVEGTKNSEFLNRLLVTFWTINVPEKEKKHENNDEVVSVKCRRLQIAFRAFYLCNRLKQPCRLFYVHTCFAALPVKRHAGDEQFNGLLNAVLWL